MTQAKAQVVASALIGAGYRVEVNVKEDGQWIIRVQDAGTPAATVSAFATTQSVTAKVTDVEFS